MSLCVCAALMYSGCGVIISKLRNAEDELNTLAAATITGLAYKSTGLYQTLHLAVVQTLWAT